MNRNVKKIISGLAAVFVLIFILALLNRTGSLILLWKEEPLGSLSHDEGHGYYAYVSDENISRLGLPFFLKEDDSILDPGALSVNEDLTATVKEQGGGAYQLQSNSDLYLSASDNQPDTHSYSILSPVIIRTRWLLALFCPAALCLAFALFRLLKYRDADILKTILRTLTAVCLLMLLLPWNRMIIPAVPRQIKGFLVKPILQRNPVFLGLLLALLLSQIRHPMRNRLLRVLWVLILLTNTVYYFVPEWDYFGQRADSAGYIQVYSASSIRTPGYPVFIEVVYHLSGNNDLEELRAANEPLASERLMNGRKTDSHGLLDVVHAQKCVLAIAWLVLSAIFCRFYPPIWFIFAAQIILCGRFLGVDNSYIMTECLSQAMTFIATATVLLTIKTKSRIAFLIQCVISALAILIRPANIFLALPILICAVILLHARRKVLIPIFGCLAFLGISAIPCLNIYRQYHIFVWMPSSGYVEIARAVSLMQPGDENAFDDPEMREFCTNLLQKKAQIGIPDQNTYMWDVAIATAEEHSYDRITCSPLFGKISRKIFLLHPKEFASGLLDTVQTALDRTRLHLGAVPFLALEGIFILLFILKINTDSLLGLGFSLLHIIHLCISMINQPERRYIYSTEILCLLGWLLILITCIQLNDSQSRQM